MITRDYSNLCVDVLNRDVKFWDNNGEEILSNIITALKSPSFAKRNGCFRLKKTSRMKIAYWCCKAGANIPIHNPTDGTVALTTVNRQFVLCDTRGIKYSISEGEIARNFSFAKGEYISPSYLREAQPGEWFKIYPLAVDGFKVGFTSSTIWALTIPCELQFSVRTPSGEVEMGNIKGIEHAVGDLLAVGDTHGMPDFNKMGIINGGVFADCFIKLNFPSYIPYSRLKGHRQPAKLFIPV